MQTDSFSLPQALFLSRMDSTVYNSLKRLRIDDNDDDRQTKRKPML